MIYFLPFSSTPSSAMFYHNHRLSLLFGNMYSPVDDLDAVRIPLAFVPELDDPFLDWRTFVETGFAKSTSSSRDAAANQK